MADPGGKKLIALSKCVFKRSLLALCLTLHYKKAKPVFKSPSDFSVFFLLVRFLQEHVEEGLFFLTKKKTKTTNGRKEGSRKERRIINI